MVWSELVTGLCESHRDTLIFLITHFMPTCRAMVQQGLVVPLQLILLLCATCTTASNIFNGLKRHNWIQSSASYRDICELEGLRLCRRVALFKKNPL